MLSSPSGDCCHVIRQGSLTQPPSARSESGASICNRNRIMTGLRFLFRVTVRRLDLAAEIYHIRAAASRAMISTPGPL
jgi:hypothetical protein